MNLVRIEWLDAAASNSWHDKPDCKISGTPVTTWGLLIFEDEKWVQIAHTDGGSAWQGVFEIPRSTVLSIEVVRELK